MAQAGPREIDLVSSWLIETAESDRLGARFAALAETVPQAVAVLARGGRALFVNECLRRRLGAAAGAEVESSLIRLVPDPAPRRDFVQALETGWAGLAADLADVPLGGADGPAQAVTVTVRPLPREVEPTLLLVMGPAPPSPSRRAGDGAPAGTLRAFGLHLAALADELRAPLSAFRDHLAALATRADLPADVRQSLALYRSVTTDTLDHLARAMEWGRRGPIEPRVDLGDLVRAALAAAQPWLPDSVEVTLDLAAVPPVPGIPGQLRLVVEHLLRNAGEALSERGGRIGVALRPGAAGNVLVVSDDGPGIPPSLRPHVFEPFSSTKSIAAGLGLGLAIVKDIVARHRGEVALASSAQGTEVRVTLPVPAAVAPAAPRRPRVLLVDDDREVQEICGALLRASGWDVLEAASADEAIYAVAGQDVDALLVDVRMAGGDGLGVVEALALWHPHLVGRAILHTGYAHEPRVRETAERLRLPLLPKPARREQILAALDAVRARAPRPA